ncbi:MAG TPA: nucleotidyltransferase domain-containing protein [Microbacteriaceae bacterium]|nr:nucleotidyltransferase domain-containing protein [Microbacteriaceae bacterium]
MDLSHPEYTLFGADKARVLRRLAMLDEPTSGRRIHQLSGVRTLRTTQRILDELVRVGLVRSRVVGRANAYRANRNHVLWPVIEAAIGVPAATEARIAEILAEDLGEQAVSTALYGSAARREAGPDSDVDIFAVWKDGAPAEHAADLVNSAATRIEEVTGNPAQIFAVDEEELGRLVAQKAPLVESLRRDARNLTGQDLRDLIVRAAR